ncbi:MAG: SLATT domain-containing protein [Fluviibacter sp.]
MTKDDLLKNIAETAYNAGFGAKKHFATYDMVNKVPGLINFFSIAVGIYALVFDQLSTKVPSATLLVFGVIALYVSQYESKKDDYEKAGVKLTQLFNDLRRLYFQAKEFSGSDTNNLLQELKNIEALYYQTALSKQIMFGDWYAHYKFFWQHQIDWIDEQKKFKFFRDKVPLSLTASLAVIGIAVVAFVFRHIESFANIASHFR